MMEKFDILLVIPHMGKGGAQKNLYEIAKILVEKRFKVGLVYSDLNNQTLDRFYSNDKIKHIVLDSYIKRSHFYKSLSKFKIFLTSNIKFTAILFEFYYYLLLVIKQFFNSPNTYKSKLISLISNTQPRLVISFLTLTNVSSIYAINEISTKKPKLIISERNNIYSERGFVFRFFLKIIYRKADYFTANNNHALSFLNYKRSFYLPNIIQNKNKTTRNKKSNKIIFVGRFVEQKNIFLILDLFLKYTLIYGNRFTLEIVGDGPQKRDILNFIQSKKLLNVTVKPFMTNDDLEKLYISAKYNIIFSKREGMPNTFLEALSHNTQTIVLDKCENLKFLAHNNLALRVRNNEFIFHDFERILNGSFNLDKKIINKFLSEHSKSNIKNILNPVLSNIFNEK